MGLIQTEDQLKFSYISIIEGARQMDLISNVPELEQVPEVNSSSDSEDDVPPPLPPPRTESLKKDTEALEVLQNSLNVNDNVQFNGIPSVLETRQLNGYVGSTGSEAEDELEEVSKVALSNAVLKALSTNESSAENSPSNAF